MSEINHEHYAKKSVGFLINHIVNFKSGNKFVTYGDLAKAIDYPKPHTGSNFGSKIGTTLGVMGHLVEEVVIDNWIGRVPFLQALVVRQDTKLPSTGLREFKTDYPDLDKEKRKDYVKLEYEKVFQFGDRWFQVLKSLGIENNKYPPQKKGKYNPFGNEGSPEHRNLRDYVAENPEYIGLDISKKGQTEYPLKSGDSIDVCFILENRIIGVEVKSIRSGNDDLERGIFQCIKYREVLKAENKISNKEKSVDCILVYEGDMDKKNIRQSSRLNVKTIQVSYNS